jgi:hypothetical protein
LIDASLQEFLIGAQIGQFIGARRRQSGCKNANG